MENEIRTLPPLALGGRSAVSYVLIRGALRLGAEAEDGNPVKVRNCPAAVSRNERSEQ